MVVARTIDIELCDMVILVGAEPDVGEFMGLVGLAFEESGGLGDVGDGLGDVGEGLLMEESGCPISLGPELVDILRAKE